MRNSPSSPRLPGPWQLSVVLLLAIGSGCHVFDPYEATDPEPVLTAGEQPAPAEQPAEMAAPAGEAAEVLHEALAPGVDPAQWTCPTVFNLQAVLDAQRFLDRDSCGNGSAWLNFGNLKHRSCVVRYHLRCIEQSCATITSARWTVNDGAGRALWQSAAVACDSSSDVASPFVPDAYNALALPADAAAIRVRVEGCSGGCHDPLVRVELYLQLVRCCP